MVNNRLEDLLDNKIDQDIIYHYTNIDSFVAILESSSLWLTYIGNVNDYMEFTHGINCFYEIFADATKKSSSKIQDNFNQLFDNMNKVKKSNICVGSFCKSGDLLGQWRAYANDGLGLSVGFSSQELSKICNTNKFHYGECVYEDRLKKGLCHDVLDMFLEELKKDNDSEEYREMVNDFIKLMLVVSLFLKDDAFKDEVEIRLATPPNMNLDVIKRGNRWVSYYPLKLETSLNTIIKEVYIGPGAEQLGLSKAVEVILKKNKITNCSIKNSDIPYRSLRSY